MTNVYVCEILLKSNYDKYEKYLNKFICVSKAVECTLWTLEFQLRFRAVDLFYL